MKRIAADIASAYQRTRLVGGEVVVTVRGSLGGVAAVSKELAGYNISREVAMLALTEPESAPLIATFIASDVLQDWLLKTKGVAYQGINLESLRLLPIPVPPPDEQKAIQSRVEERLMAADALRSATITQLALGARNLETIITTAMSGNLLPSVAYKVGASDLLTAIAATIRGASTDAGVLTKNTKKVVVSVANQNSGAKTLRAAWDHSVSHPDAQQLFHQAGYKPEQVLKFYEDLRAESDICESLSPSYAASEPVDQSLPTSGSTEESSGRFRLEELWLEDFKNLKDYTVRFNRDEGTDVVLGWNGTGKSNLFEALVIVFRDLNDWVEHNRWSLRARSGFRISYSINNALYEIAWHPQSMKRPQVRRLKDTQSQTQLEDWQPVKREQLALPRFIFGYYSGPTNRLAEHFLPMKQAHYERLRTTETDDHGTLSRLLEQRRFFCAETHHAKYVLLAFSYRKDPTISAFLEQRLRIVGFESALFVIRKPDWARKGHTAKDFWGAHGIMRRVMERLRKFAVAPLTLEQKVAYGYRTRTEEHSYFFLPDQASLHAFAAEYENARTFFLALESVDFSELIHDVQIQVMVRSLQTEAIFYQV